MALTRSNPVVSVANVDVRVRHLRAVEAPTRVLPAPAAFALQASIAVLFLAASIAPTPLYPVYQAAWGFSPAMLSLVFGVYAVAVLGALLTAGALSDHVGRRPVLLAALVVEAATMLLFAGAGSVGTLLLARVIQGLATGAAIAAVGAGMLDLDRARGAIANAVAPMTGTATGGIISALMFRYLPAPTRLVYLVFLALFLVQAAGVIWMAETSPGRPGAWASLRPRFRLPTALRRPLLMAAPALVAAWALAGFYGSLGPALLRRLTGSTSPVVSGLVLLLLAGTGAATVLVLRNRPARGMLTFGTAALVVGVGLSLLAVSRGSTALFFVSAVVTGAGFGAGFQGAIRSVVPLAQPHERAGVLSVVYLVSYLALGLPAVLAGLRVAHGGGLYGTTREYGVAVMVLAAAAFLGAVARRAPQVTRGAGS
jgi:MFS family permease